MDGVKLPGGAEVGCRKPEAGGFDLRYGVPRELCCGLKAGTKVGCDVSNDSVTVPINIHTQERHPKLPAPIPAGSVTAKFI